MRFNKERQVIVLDGLSKGLSKEKIAHNLGVSPRTVDRYIDLLKIKHEANSLAHLMGNAFRANLIR